MEAYNGATEELTRIEADRALNTRHLSIAKNNLVVAQRRLGDRIRAMYKQPQDDSTLAILLGSHNLTEFLDSVETANSVASQDTQVVGEIKRFKHDVTVRAAFLKKAQARQEQIVSAAGRGQAGDRVRARRAPAARRVDQGRDLQARGGRAGAPGAARRRGAAAAPGRALRAEGGGAAGPAVRHGRRRRLRDHAGRRLGRAPGPLRRRGRGRNAVPRHPVRLGWLLARRLRLLRVRDVRLRAGRRLPASPRGRPVQLRHARLARRARAGRPRLLRRPRARRDLHRRRPVHPLTAHGRRGQDLEPERRLVLVDIRRRAAELS